MVIELAGDVPFSRDLAAGGVFIPGCRLRLAEECDLVVCGANHQLLIPARVVYVDEHRGAGLELIGFSTEMKAQLAELEPLVLPEPDVADAEIVVPVLEGRDPASDDDLAVPMRHDADDDLTVPVSLGSLVDEDDDLAVPVATGTDDEDLTRRVASDERSTARGATTVRDLAERRAPTGREPPAVARGAGGGAPRGITERRTPTGVHAAGLPAVASGGATRGITERRTPTGDPAGASSGARRGIAEPHKAQGDGPGSPAGGAGAGAPRALLERSRPAGGEPAGLVGGATRGTHERSQAIATERAGPGPGLDGTRGRITPPHEHPAAGLAGVSHPNGAPAPRPGFPSPTDPPDALDDAPRGEPGRAGVGGMATGRIDVVDCDADAAALAAGDAERAGEPEVASEGAGADDEADDPVSGGARRIPPSVRQRLRGLALTAQIKLAAGGELHERIVLEQLYGKNVWETLLRNPRLTAPEVARIARYGSLPRVLIEVIVGNNAWLQVPEIRRALLANPRLAPDQIMKVLRLTPKHELKLAAIQTAYPHGVRNAARLLLRGD